MATCKECFHKEACFKMLEEGMGFKIPDGYEGGADRCDTYLPAADVVSRNLYEQIKWERDLAMAQLEEHGISFGAKKSFDLAKVVKCKNCTEWNEAEGECSHWYGFRENDFCSYGERKE